MSDLPQSIRQTRAAQIYPSLTESEIGRLRRFGQPRRFEAGEALARVAETGLGLTIILSGEVEITRHDPNGHREHIITHGPGNFMGELAQLSGRPSLVDAHARGEVQVLAIPPERLRALLV